MVSKAPLRTRMLARRAQEPDRDHKSERILDRIFSLEHYAQAAIMSTYVGVDSEVATIPLIRSACAEGRTLVVPWMDGGHIRLARIEALDELVPSAFGLLEPTAQIRVDTSRQMAPTSCDLFLVPGVAFDRMGNRLGHGRGYYDELLARVPHSATRIGLAFECQLVERVPTEPHDQRMDLVVTELGTYGGATLK